MADANKLNETWARAASMTSRHERDYLVEVLREVQREKDAREAAPSKKADFSAERISGT